jgi:hypothetical protein
MRDVEIACEWSEGHPSRLTRSAACARRLAMFESCLAADEAHMSGDLLDHIDFIVLRGTHGERADNRWNTSGLDASRGGPVSSTW